MRAWLAAVSLAVRECCCRGSSRPPEPQARLFQLVATFAESPRDELLAEANEVLATLAVEPLPR